MRGCWLGAALKHKRITLPVANKDLRVLADDGLSFVPSLWIPAAITSPGYANRTPPSVGTNLRPAA